MLAEITITRLLVLLVSLYGTYRLVKFLKNSIPQKYRIASAIGIACLLIVGFLMYVSSVQEKMGLRSSAHPESMEKIEIRLDGKVSLSIPKAYLTNPSTWKGGGQEVVTIEAVLPDLLPVKHVQHVQKTDIVYIDLDIAVSDSRKSGAFEEIKKLRPYLIATGYGLDKLKPEFYKAEQAGKIQGGAYFSHNDYYLGLLPDRFLKIKCDDIAGFCEVRTNFTRQIMGVYSIDKQRIPAYWREVDNKIISLINKFVSKGE